MPSHATPTSGPIQSNPIQSFRDGLVNTSASPQMLDGAVREGGKLVTDVVPS